MGKAADGLVGKLLTSRAPLLTSPTSPLFLPDDPSGYLHRPSGAPLETCSLTRSLGNKLGSESKCPHPSRSSRLPLPATGFPTPVLSCGFPSTLFPSKLSAFATPFFDVLGKVLWTSTLYIEEGSSQVEILPVLAHRTHRLQGRWRGCRRGCSFLHPR